MRGQRGPSDCRGNLQGSRVEISNQNIGLRKRYRPRPNGVKKRTRSAIHFLLLRCFSGQCLGLEQYYCSKLMNHSILVPLRRCSFRTKSGSYRNKMYDLHVAVNNTARVADLCKVLADR